MKENKYDDPEFFKEYKRAYLMNEPGMKDELRRPMMLLVAACKK